MRRFHAIALVLGVAVLATAGCGDDGGSAGGSGESAEWCAALTKGDPKGDFEELSVTKRDAAALATQVALVRDLIDGTVTTPDDRLEQDGETARAFARARDSLTLLGEEVEESCGSDAPALTRVADAQHVADVAGAERSDLYCDELAAILEPDQDGDEANPFAPLAGVASLAPEEHRTVIGQISGDLAAVKQLPTEDAVRYALEGNGMAMYAEATCGIENGAARLALLVALTMSELAEDATTTTTAAP
jgi:hypothetical protein